MPRAAAAGARPAHVPHPVRPVENIDIARIFEEVADLLEIQSENAFRIGPAAGRAIAAFFRRPENQAVIERAPPPWRHGYPVSKGERAARAAPATVAFTGTLQTMSRADARQMVERHGGRAEIA